MSDGIMSILVLAGLGIICAAIGYVGNRIADKAGRFIFRFILEPDNERV